MDSGQVGRPPTRRRHLQEIDAQPNRAAPRSSHQYSDDRGHKEYYAPAHEGFSSSSRAASTAPAGPLSIRREYQPSPENKRISAISNENRDSKRDSQISTASSTGSNPRRRKTHIGPWQLGKTIGRGGCGRVRIVRHCVTGQVGAAKIISKAAAEKVRAISLANLIKSAEAEPSMFPGGKVIPFGLEREIVIMRLLEHPNIVRLHDVWENSNELYLIMEYVQGGDLLQYIGDLREIEVVHLFRQIIAGLMYCHRLNIHHRDLKPENILLDRTNWNIKLVDFGMAALQPHGRKLSTPCGSPQYAAPEVIWCRPYDGAKADIWSCGVILYVLLTGTSPFIIGGDERGPEGLRELFHAIKKAKYIMPDDISPEAQDLIRRILVTDPKQRISIDQIWVHPFLHKYDTELGHLGSSADLARWVGPEPQLDNWRPLTLETIDREILRNMRTLWHSEKPEVIKHRLVNQEVNQEKLFYAALLKHRDEQLENYVPPPTAYSASDHHHRHRPVVGSRDETNPPHRSRSAYSILRDEHLYSRHSFYEPPPSEHSYDPFRASREPIVPETDSPINITVHRDSVESQAMRPETALGHHQEGSLRVKALRNSSRRSSNFSAGRSARSGRSGRSFGSKKSSIAPSQRSAATAYRNVSRSTLGSSQWASSPPVAVKASTRAKRGVSFTHLRQGSTITTTTNESGGPRYTPEQRNFLNRPSNATSSSKSTQQSEAREQQYTREHHANYSRVSHEVSSSRPAQPEESYGNRHGSEQRESSSRAYDAASSIRSPCPSEAREHQYSSEQRNSIYRPANVESKSLAPSEAPKLNLFPDRVGARAPSSPKIPRLRIRKPESPSKYIQSEARKVSTELEKTLFDAFRLSEDPDTSLTASVTDRTKLFFDTPPTSLSNGHSVGSSLATPHTSGGAPERPLPPLPASPAPKETPNSFLQRKLAETREEIARKMEDDGGDNVGYFNEVLEHLDQLMIPPGRNSQRISSAPPRAGDYANVLSPITEETKSSETEDRPNLQGRRAVTEQHTIRVVDASPPYIAPLNILSQPSPQAPPTVRPSRDVYQDLLAAREQLTANPQSDALPTTNDGKTLVKKKSFGWFRRLAGEKDDEPAPVPKRTPTPKLPDSWKGRDDRNRKSAVPPPPAIQISLADEPSDGSSEFHMRGPSEEKGQPEKGSGRRGLFHFFSKSKWSKGKSTADIDLSGNQSSESFFDLASGSTDGPPRPPDRQTNWLARFLHIKPATGAICFRVGRGRVRTELVRLLREWQGYGVNNIAYDRRTNVIEASVSKHNHLGMKPVALVIELFVVLEHGHRAKLCIARFTQTRGAASSFHRVLGLVEDVCRAKNIVVLDPAQKTSMLDTIA